jgi:hypothetical protein
MKTQVTIKKTILRKGAILAFLIPLYLLVAGAHHKAARDSAAVTITLHTVSTSNKSVDSVLVIFDKFDRTGAGIVKQVYYPVRNQISIIIPKGKYYVDLICLGGTHNREHLDGVVNAKVNKRNAILFHLKESAVFEPGSVRMPAEKIDPSNFSITHIN